MRLGIVLPQHSSSPKHLIDAAVQAEQAGLDSVWLSDHLQGWSVRHRPFLECVSCLAAVAVSTESIGLGTLVLRAGLRPPAVVAAVAKTLQDVSLSRLTLGLGAGDPTIDAEESSFGLPSRSSEDRRTLLVELVDHLRTQLPQLPLVIAGSSAEAVSLARKVGSWNLWGSLEELEARISQVGPELRPGRISWAGMFPGIAGIESLRRLGISEAVVAVGTGNYEERIAQLSGIVDG